MEKKITALFVILWIAAMATLCRGWGEEAFRDAMDKAKTGVFEAKKGATEAMQGAKQKTASWDAMDKAKTGVFEAKKGASEAMQGAKQKTASWANSASNSFSEGFGYDKKNVKDGSRRLMFEVTGALNAAARKAKCYKACEMSRNNESNQEARSSDYAYSRWNFESKNSRRPGNSKDTILDQVFEAIHLLEIIAKNERDIAIQRENDPNRKKIIDQKVNIIKLAIQGVFSPHKLRIILGEDGPELVQKYRDAKSNLQETYRIVKETRTQITLERFKEARKKVADLARELRRRIGAEEF